MLQFANISDILTKQSIDREFNYTWMEFEKLLSELTTLLNGPGYLSANFILQKIHWDWFHISWEKNKACIWVVV